MKLDFMKFFLLWNKSTLPYSKVCNRQFHYGKKLSQIVCPKKLTLKRSFYIHKKQPYCSHVVQQFHKPKDTNKEYDCFEDQEYKQLVQPIYNLPESGHSVIVLQPDLINPEEKNIAQANFVIESNVKPKLLLEETISLIQGLKNWTVKQHFIVTVKKLNKYLGFDSADVEALIGLVRTAQRQHGITAVVVSTTFLHGKQILNLQSIFQLPVYDRFFITWQTMKQNATSKEAKLQVGLSEFHLIKNRLNGTYGSRSHSLMTKGTGESFLETRHKLSSKRDMKIKVASWKIQSKLHSIKSSADTKDCPIVSVVGYTNAGKTSLIKALTNDTELEPSDKPLSTLDLSTHTGVLPNGTPVIYVDTMGFIGDVPNVFFSKFSKTLQDIQLSDLIIHVRNANHPACSEQKHVVMNLLTHVGIPSTLLDTVIEVNNKADLQTGEANSPLQPISVSCLTGEGVPSLQNAIQEKIMSALKSRVVQ